MLVAHVYYAGYAAYMFSAVQDEKQCTKCFITIIVSQPATAAAQQQQCGECDCYFVVIARVVCEPSQERTHIYINVLYHAHTRRSHSSRAVQVMMTLNGPGYEKKKNEHLNEQISPLVRLVTEGLGSFGKLSP